jgi:hypothetical protein
VLNAVWGKVAGLMVGLFADDEGQMRSFEKFSKAQAEVYKSIKEARDAGDEPLAQQRERLLAQIQKNQLAENPAAARAAAAKMTEAMTQDFQMKSRRWIASGQSDQSIRRASRRTAARD